MTTPPGFDSSQLVALRDAITQLRDQAATPDAESCGADQVCKYL